MRWMHLYRTNKYVLRTRLKQSVLIVGTRTKSGREFQTVGAGNGNSATAGSVETDTRYCRQMNAECQHRESPRKHETQFYYAPYDASV